MSISEHIYLYIKCIHPTFILFIWDISQCNYLAQPWCKVQISVFVWLVGKVHMGYQTDGAETFQRGFIFPSLSGREDVNYWEMCCLQFISLLCSDTFSSPVDPLPSLQPNVALIKTRSIRMIWQLYQQQKLAWQRWEWGWPISPLPGNWNSDKF